MAAFAAPGVADAALRELARGSPDVTLAAIDDRTVCEVGNPAGRERIWLQADAAGAPAVAGYAAWAMLDSLLASRLNRHRHVLLGRTRLAIVAPGAARYPSRPTGAPPALDAGLLGATPALVAALQTFRPTVLVHLQDWGTTASEDVDGSPAPRGVRAVESFFLAPELHERLGQHGHRRSFVGRPTALARALDDHPDARTGAQVQRHVRRMGYRASSETAAAGAVLLTPGRFAPRLPWRRLGAANLAEVALASNGTAGFTGQTFDAPAEERAGQALAFAEAAVLFGVDLETQEAAR